MTNEALAALITMLEQRPGVTEATLNAIQSVNNAIKQAISDQADDHSVTCALVDGIALMLVGRVPEHRRASAATDALMLLHARLDQLAMFDGADRNAKIC